MDLILAKKRVLLLVSGGIAIYKSLDLISNLKKEGAEVFVVMSEEATRFIAPLTFETMSGNKVLCKSTESFPQISHIAYANLADIAIIAPATINTIAKLNYGIADNLIVETLLACKCEVFIAPSANVNMLESPQNKVNLDSLKNMGYTIIPPRVSRLACDIVANGAMAEVGEIIFQLKREIVGNSSLDLHSADFANLGRLAQTSSLALRPKFAKNHESQTENPSVVDSARNAQNLGENSEKFAESSLDSAESQNLGENNSVRSTQTRPLRGAKNRDKASSSGKADFLLEAEKRGSPPKSEKAAAFWGHNKKELGGAGRGVQPFLREKTSEISGEGNAESSLDSATKDKFPNFWRGKNIIITGGGSVESIDSIRHISNDSSGKQASNLALAFYYLGANVSLIASKIPISLPLGVEKIAVKSSADFKSAIEAKLNSIAESSIFISAAAISDFIPAQKVQGKLKKEQIGEIWDLQLRQNEDILSEISKKFGKKTFIVGFKAESELDSASVNAKKMLTSKGCDMVVLNVISKANQIGGERNEVRIFTAQDEIKIPQDSKLNISFAIAESIAQNLAKSPKSQNLAQCSKKS